MKVKILIRLALSAAATAMAAVPALFAPACLGSSSTATDGGSSSSGSATASSSGVNPSSEGGDAGVTCAIDDMSSPGTSTGGYWFTFSDRVCDNTTLVMAGAVGTVSPAEGYSFFPMADGMGMAMTTMLPGLSTAVGYREATGGGEKVWGVGFGFNFLNNGTNPFVACPASTCTGTPPAVDASVGFPAPYDASSHKGLTFFARSPTATATSPTKLRVQLSDSHTDPGGGMPGAMATSSMVCDQCSSATTNATNRCTNDFYKAITIGPDWQQFTVLFSEIATDTWTKTYKAGTFDPTSLYHVHWQFNGSAAAPVPNFKVQVACVSWAD